MEGPRKGWQAAGDKSKTSGFRDYGGVKTVASIYIMTDLEGVSGIDSADMIERDHPRFRECCELLMGDLNAAVEGAFEGGATRVMVRDGHGGAPNFIPELLDPRAEEDPRPAARWWGQMDSSFDATFIIGAHAMAGTLNAFLDHTQSSVAWHDYIVNGRRMGELAQWAIIAGHFGVPLVMVSGDAAACGEAEEFFQTVETAVVKEGVGRNSARLVPLDEARRRIREAARRAVGLIGMARPFHVEPPLEIILRFNRSDYCDRAAGNPGVERVDARTIRKLAASPLEILP